MSTQVMVNQYSLLTFMSILFYGATDSAHLVHIPPPTPAAEARPDSDDFELVKLFRPRVKKRGFQTLESPASLGRIISRDLSRK
jgi:hypothetical protein